MAPAEPTGLVAPIAPATPVAHQRALHAIALFEAVKGLVALAASLGVLGLLSYLHHDVHRFALAMLWRFHLDPALPYPTLLLHYADLLGAVNLRQFAPVAMAYVAIRWLEAWGLWQGKIWAEWLGALSGALYIPLEVAHLVHRTTFINAAVLAANVAIVAFLAVQLWRRLKRPAAKAV